VLRLIYVISLALLASCDLSAPEEDPINRARSHSSLGEYELALAALRVAAREQPSNAEIRFMMAEVYLDLGQGALALTALEQALERGLDSGIAALPNARGLFLEKRWDDLKTLTIPKESTLAVKAKILWFKAEALANQSIHVDGSDDSVVRAYIELFRLIHKSEGDSEIAEMEKMLGEKRKYREDINRAWQHSSCALQPRRSVAWEPLERSGGQVLRVGPDRQLTTIEAAASEAKNGDVVEIDSATYRGGVALWPQSDIVVRGVGERPVITADGLSIRQRDVWLFTGNNVVVENIDISGARSPWTNGAGIRHTGSGLTLRHVFLHDNENGLLTSNGHPDTSEILIEYSEFSNNGDNKGYAHNIYIGRSKRFELRYSYSHDSIGGHLVKSRAGENLITYNRLTDEENGRSSYVIDIPEGGIATVVGNVIEQSPVTMNHGIISFGGDKSLHSASRLLIVNNSIYNRDFKGIVLRNNKDLAVVMANNLIGGAPAIITESRIDRINNLSRPDHGMNDPRKYDYELLAGAAAIDAGVDFEIKPEFEYVHPLQRRERKPVWRMDVGAYERCGLD
jgi:hypothetical protein